MIQTFEDIIRRFCPYGLELKDSDGFTHNWCTLIPELELAYRTSIHASTGKTPAMLENDGTLRLQNHENKSMHDAFEYDKQKWDKSHKTPEFKVEDFILVSTLNFNNIQGQKKFKDSFAGPFIIKALNGKNSVQVELSGELENKHPPYPVSLVKHLASSDKELFL
ncbi:hypothetical protein O181_097614 [Austropuccinia psidii MF-1]|uniref:Uncharacterized protein n=1 Tax=Austropuccinia psidii MF-1 TaxID=1389203 RepID=A0A9Q3PDS1_9BASI|nr:hypothetical protein [Austropuccinia psidii MF-1]